MSARAARATLPPETERDFTAKVGQLAHMLGWTYAHFRPALRADGSWRTPLQGDGAGFPDLVLVRGIWQGQLPRCIFAELKAEDGKLSPLQALWLANLRQVEGIEVYVWKPSQLQPEILGVLT